MGCQLLADSGWLTLPLFRPSRPFPSLYRNNKLIIKGLSLYYVNIIKHTTLHMCKLQTNLLGTSFHLRNVFTIFIQNFLTIGNLFLRSCSFPLLALTQIRALLGRSPPPGAKPLATST